jgi:hypothetical protein
MYVSCELTRLARLFARCLSTISPQRNCCVTYDLHTHLKHQCTPRCAVRQSACLPACLQKQTQAFQKFYCNSTHGTQLLLVRRNVTKRGFIDFFVLNNNWKIDQIILVDIMVHLNNLNVIYRLKDRIIHELYCT